MEDSSTYGAAPFEAFHVENGKFVFDYIGGRLGWGQSETNQDPNLVLGTANMNIGHSGLNDAFVLTTNLSDGSNSSETIAALTDRAIC